ncbi:uncharacterized protein N7459_002854 [Penicillium hispanicum]|uniref:uncharacterized protein n=1 Tax=Penicillium hispanicum TaxID=1080232 RepID=UPI0025410BCA|nr:uncharacterized protein N7459_002854 [Penicillium hispanicum]KAJ5587089.1 hypothetical protein N7459_002854 [Penicillium hispanicum]
MPACISSGPQLNPQGPGLGSSPWLNRSPYHHDHYHAFSSLAPPLECVPSAVSCPQSFDTFAQESELWTEPDLSFADTDWNFLTIDHVDPYPAILNGADMTVDNLGYGVPSTFSSLSDSGSNGPRNLLSNSLAPSSANSQDEHSHTSPISQIPGSVSTSQSSPATSQGDDILGRVDSSRVEKRRLNTLAARRSRQRRVDRMKSLEDELESVRRERDELRLRVSKLEGETEALKGLVTRKSR